MVCLTFSISSDLVRFGLTWSSCFVLLLLLDDFFYHLSMKNFIFFKKIYLGRSAAVGFARQILYNNRAFQGYYIIYILFTSFNIFLLLLFLFFASFFSFSHFLSFCLLFDCIPACDLFVILFVKLHFSLVWKLRKIGTLVVLFCL